MRTVMLAAVAAVALAGAAHAQVTGPDYVKMAGASDKFEMTEAKLAEQRSHNPKIKHYAMMMVRDHTKSTMMVKTAATKVMGHAPAPPMLTDEQQQDLAALKATHGSDFDRTYLDQQVASHQKALDLQQGYAQNGEVAPLKRAATEITPVVQSHLQMAKDLQSSMMK